jgi:hypothetical protein
MDGWYLYTLPEHYRLHNCQIEQTKKERLSNTVHFKHKHITNPTLTPTDKLMKALANCKAALEGKLNDQLNEQLWQLRMLVDNLEIVTTMQTRHGRSQGFHNSSAKPPREPTSSRVPSLASSRVPGNEAMSWRVQQAPSYLYMTWAIGEMNNAFGHGSGGHWRT